MEPGNKQQVNSEDKKTETLAKKIRAIKATISLPRSSEDGKELEAFEIRVVRGREIRTPWRFIISNPAKAIQISESFARFTNASKALVKEIREMHPHKLNQILNNNES
jgi:hypothetical protein